MTPPARKPRLRALSHKEKVALTVKAGLDYTTLERFLTGDKPKQPKTRAAWNILVKEGAVRGPMLDIATGAPIADAAAAGAS